MNYACHAVCLMWDNFLTSADYPGYAVHHFEQRVPGAMGLFFQGACGNVNPRETSWHHGQVTGSNFHIASRAGEELGREAARVWSKTETTDEVRIACASRTITLPGNHARALQAARENLANTERAAQEPPLEIHPYLDCYSPPDPVRARKRLARLEAEGEKPVRCELQALTLGPVTFLAWPAEVVCELGIDLKERSPLRPTYALGYANGYLGYIPTPEMHREGGYEAQAAAHLADDAGLVLVEESLRLLAGLGKEGDGQKT
jgi:hypothetical protein